MPSVPSSSVSALPVAQCLDAALGLFRAALPACLPYGVLTVLSSQVPQLPLAGGTRAPLLSPLWWVVNLISALLLAVLWNASLLRVAAVAAQRQGRPGRPRMRDELSAALGRAPAVLGLVLMLACAAALLLGPAWFLGAAARPWAVAAALLILLHLAVPLSVAWTPLVVQRRSLPASLAEGVRRVRGNAWRVLAVYLVGALMMLVLAALASVLIALIAPLVGGDDLALISSIAADVVVACGAVFVPFWAAQLFTVAGSLAAAGPVGAAPAAAAPAAGG